MSTPKPTRAWAVLRENGEYLWHSITINKGSCEKWSVEGERVIQVLITPLTSEGQEKK